MWASCAKDADASDILMYMMKPPIRDDGEGAVGWAGQERLEGRVVKGWLYRPYR